MLSEMRLLPKFAFCVRLISAFNIQVCCNKLDSLFGSKELYQKKKKHTLLSTILLNVVNFDCSLLAVFHISVNEDVDAILSVFKYIVSTSSDDYAGTFVSKFLDNLMLQYIKSVVDRKLTVIGKAVAETVKTHREGIK